MTLTSKPETAPSGASHEPTEATAEGDQVVAAPPPRPSRLLRYLFYLVWMFLVPGALAVGAVRLLEPEPFALDVGPIRSFIGEQQVPATIMFYTVFAMVLWRLRYALPFAGSVGILGRSDIPAKLRPKFDDAQNLLAEARRIMAQRERELRKSLKTSQRDDLEGALEALERAMKAEKLDGPRFVSALTKAEQLVQKHLGRWRKGELREYGESIGVAVAVALILRFFVIEAFKIPSGSMIPTLMIGDHIFVAKYAYGPLLPHSDTRLYDALPPDRGDVIVFKFPENKDQDFIKRVIALPGDRLESIGGRPIINGWLVPNCSVGRLELAGMRGHLYLEYLGDHTFLTLYDDLLPATPCESDGQCPQSGSCRGGICGLLQGPYEVEPGQLWVMGDNRNNSHDSRSWRGGRGAGVPFENIKGRAMFVWWSWDPRGGVATDRVFVNVMGAPKLPPGVPPELTAGLAKCLRERPPVAETTPPPAPR